MSREHLFTSVCSVQITTTPIQRPEKKWTENNFVPPLFVNVCRCCSYSSTASGRFGLQSNKMDDNNLSFDYFMERQ